MKVKQLLTNVIWYGIIPKTPAILMILVLPFITPFLTLEDYGIMGLINSYKGIAIGMVTFGLHMHLTNSFFELKDKFKLLWRRIYFYLAIASIFTSICLFFVFIFSLPIDLLTQKIFISTVAVIPILLSSTDVFTNHYYPLVLQPKRQVLTRLSGAIVSILFAFVTIRYYGFGYSGWVIGSALSSIIIFSLFIKPFNIDLKIYPQPDYNILRIKKLLKKSLPIIPHNLGHLLLSSSDRIVMKILAVTVANIGLYSNGYQIGENANTVIQGLFIALTPILQQSYREKNIKKMKYYYRFSTLIVSIFIFFCILWMKEFYQIFIRNDSLRPAYILAMLICSSYLVGTPLYFYLSSSIMIEKKTKKILYLTFIPALLNIVLNFIFIPFFGYIAAIYTSMFSYSFVILLPFVMTFFKDTVRNMLDSRKVLMEGFILNLIVLIMSFSFHNFSVLFKLIISAIILFAGYIFYKKKLEHLNVDN